MYVNSTKLREFLNNGGIEVLDNAVHGDIRDKLFFHANVSKDQFFDDADLDITLHNNGDLIAMSGIASGLQSYYVGHWHYIEEEHLRLIDSMKGKPIIVQMQAWPDKDGSLDQIEWRKLMMNWWEKYMVKQGVAELYMLPAELNRWVLPKWVKNIDSGELTARKEVLHKNYDQTAQINGYTKDFSGLYVKKLSKQIEH